MAYNAVRLHVTLLDFSSIYTRPTPCSEPQPTEVADMTMEEGAGESGSHGAGSTTRAGMPEHRFVYKFVSKSMYIHATSGNYASQLLSNHWNIRRYSDELMLGTGRQNRRKRKLMLIGR